MVCTGHRANHLAGTRPPNNFLGAFTCLGVIHLTRGRSRVPVAVIPASSRLEPCQSGSLSGLSRNGASKTLVRSKALEKRGSCWTILGAGRAGDPSQPPRTTWGSPAPSAQPTDEAKQMQDPSNSSTGTSGVVCKEEEEEEEEGRFIQS